MLHSLLSLLFRTPIFLTLSYIIDFQYVTSISVLIFYDRLKKSGEMWGNVGENVYLCKRIQYYKCTHAFFRQDRSKNRR